MLLPDGGSEVVAFVVGPVPSAAADIVISVAECIYSQGKEEFVCICDQWTSHAVLATAGELSRDYL